MFTSVCMISRLLDSGCHPCADDTNDVVFSFREDDHDWSTLDRTDGNETVFKHRMRPIKYFEIAIHWIQRALLLLRMTDHVFFGLPGPYHHPIHISLLNYKPMPTKSMAEYDLAVHTGA